MMQRIFVRLLSIMLVVVATSAHAYYPITKKSLPKSATSFGGVYPTYPTINYGTGPEAQLIQRGEYIAKSADCIACHTDVDHNGQAYAGGLAIDTPFGRFYSPNITQDKENGLGKWSEADFIRAMREGKAPDGSNYFPVFPFIYFNKMTDSDLRALWAYMKKIPVSNAKNKGNNLPFPLNVRAMQGPWRMMFFNGHKGQLQYDGNKGEAWNRGAYLVEGPGHCGMCHTPMNPLGAPKRQYNLSGGFIDNYWAPNITGEGLAEVAPAELVKVFKRDQLPNNAGDVAGPMREVNHDSLAFMTDNDLYAIATYLKSVRSKNPMGVSPTYQQPSLARGKTIYRAACASCHQDGVGGAPMITDSDNWFLRAKERGNITMYRHTISGYNKMPIRGGCVSCSDEDVVSAVDYLLSEALTRDQKKQLLSHPQPVKADAAVGEEVYRTHCSVCHAQGALSAPVTGDKEAWSPIIAKGMDVLIASTLKGNEKMPAKGGCKYCRNTEVIAAVKYMVQQSRTSGDYKLW